MKDAPKWCKPIARWGIPEAARRREGRKSKELTDALLDCIVFRVRKNPEPGMPGAHLDNRTTEDEIMIKRGICIEVL